MFGTLGFGDLESTCTSGTMHWKRSWSLVGFWRLSGCWFCCVPIVWRSCCHLQIFGQQPLAALLQPWFWLYWCASHVWNVSMLCAMLKSKLMMRHAAFSCQKKAGGFPKWRHVSGAVLIWNFGWHIRQCFLICLGSDGEIEQALDEDFTPPGSKLPFFWVWPNMRNWMDPINIHCTVRKTCGHAAMISWLVEVSCLTRCQLGDESNCVGLRATWRTKFQ